MSRHVLLNRFRCLQRTEVGTLNVLDELQLIHEAAIEVRGISDMAR
jgi:hypothetical protein